jgi:hypothetical protein
MLTQEFPEEFDFEIFDLKNKVTTLSRVATSLKQTDIASLGERVRDDIFYTKDLSI